MDNIEYMIEFLKSRATKYVATAHHLEAGNPEAYSKEMLMVMAAQAYRALSERDMLRAAELSANFNVRYFVQDHGGDNEDAIDTPFTEEFDLTHPPFDLGDIGDGEF